MDWHDVPTELPSTVTRRDLAQAVYHGVGLSRQDASRLVEEVLEEITCALIRGETVSLSKFGVFEVRTKNERMGRNPRTGVAAVITPRRVVRFRPAIPLRARVNENPNLHSR